MHSGLCGWIRGKLWSGLVPEDENSETWKPLTSCVIAYKSFCSGFTLQTNFIQGQFAFYPFFFFFFYCRNQSVQSLSRSVVSDSATPWIAACQASLSIHQLPEFTQTHVHRVSDAIQPSHPLSSPSPPAPNPSQHQSFPMSRLFAWGGQSIGVSALALVLPMNTRTDLL